MVIATAALGMPLLGCLLPRQGAPAPGTARLAGGVLAVLASGIVGAMAMLWWTSSVALPKDIAVYSRQALLDLGPDRSRWPRYLALQVQAGTPIQLLLDIQGNVLKSADEVVAVNYTIAQDMELLMIDGALAHQVRRPGGQWVDSGGWLRITELALRPDLGQASGLLVHSRAKLELGGLP